MNIDAEAAEEHDGESSDAVAPPDGPAHGRAPSERLHGR